MKKIFVTVIIFFSTLTYSQIGINTDWPKATLDIVSSPNGNSKADGIIAPRITGNELKVKDVLYTNEQIGAIVYVTQAATPVTDKTINVTAPGYYYFDGSLWLRFVEAATNATITANNGLTAIGNNIKLGGTLTESTEIVTGTNNINFTGNGRIGIGTTSPVHKLDISGTMRVGPITNGNAIPNTGDLGFYNQFPNFMRFATPAISRINFYTDAAQSNNFRGTNAAVTVINNNLGVGTEGPSQRLDVNGNVRLRGVPVSNSLSSGDAVVALQSDGTAKKVPLVVLDDVLLKTFNTPTVLHIGGHRPSGIGQTKLDIVITHTVTIPPRTEMVILVNYSVPFGTTDASGSLLRKTTEGHLYVGIGFYKEDVKLLSASRKHFLDTGGVSYVDGRFSEKITNNGTANMTVKYSLYGYVESSSPTNFPFDSYLIFNAHPSGGLNWGEATMQLQTFSKKL